MRVASLGFAAWLLALFGCAAEPGAADWPAPPTESGAREQAACDAFASLRADASVETVVWYGRRLAYLGRYEDAIAVYTQGLARFPGDAELLRHRGHRFISTRAFESAVQDLTFAAGAVAGTPDRVEPDGQPNALGIPRSTLHTNIYYHLALAHYCRGEFAEAQAAWSECRRRSPNDDMRVAASYWLWITAQRLGDAAAARSALAGIRPEMDIIENRTYHRLCLLFGGQLELSAFQVDPTAPAGTADYGIARWHIAAGRPAEGLKALHHIAATGAEAAFGRIAAEADLAFLR